MHRHASRCILAEGGGRVACVATAFAAVDGPRDVGWRPLDSIIVILSAGFARHGVYLRVLCRRFAVKGIGVHLAVGANLLEVDLVPIRPCNLGTLLPQKERADDAVTGRMLDACLEAAIGVSLGAVEL